MREQNKSFSFLDHPSRKGNGNALFTKIAFIQNGMETTMPETGESLVVRLYFIVKQFINQCFFAISFNTLEGENKILLSSELINKSFHYVEGEHFVDCSIGKNPLQNGEYSLNLFLKSNNDIVDWIQEAVVVEIAPGDFYGTGRIVENGNSSVLIQQTWN
jgi:lipopolysaccharide transport system ATP-binding protein